MWTDLSFKLDQLRLQINQDTQGLIEPLQKELDTEMSKTKEMIQSVRNDNLKAFEEIRRLRSMEQHKHMLQAYPAPVEKDVLEAEFKRTNDAIQDLYDATLQLGEDISSMKSLAPAKSRSGRSATFTPSEKGLNKSDLDDMFGSLREILSEIDFTDLLDGIKQIIPVNTFRDAFAGLEERMSRLSEEMSSIHDEVRNRRAEVDFTPVLEALATSDLHSSAAEILTSVDELKEQTAKGFDTLPSLVLAQQPMTDFSPVLQSIQENRVTVDLSPLLAAINDLNVREDMSQQFAAILEDIQRNQGQVDFSELLDTIRMTKMKVDFTQVLCSLDEMAETTSQMILDGLKSPLSTLSESDAQILEKLQDLADSKEVMTSLSGLKDLISRNSQQLSLCLQNLGEEKEAKVDFSPVFEAIEENKVKIDFTDVLAAIKKHGDHTVLSEDLARLAKNVQEMKVSVDFTPVLRGLRDAKVDTVFEVLNAIRDQRTDVGEMKDALVRQSEEVSSRVQSLQETLQAESKEALTSEVLNAIQSREACIDFSDIIDAFGKQKAEIDESISEMQVRLDVDARMNFDEVRNSLRSLEEGNEQRSENLMQAFNSLQGQIGAQPDFSQILQAIKEKQFVYDDANIRHALEDQAIVQEQMQEELKETVASWHRHAEALKLAVRERVDSVVKAVSGNEAADVAAVRNEVMKVLEVLKEHATKRELDEQFCTLLRSIEALQLQQESQSSRMLTTEIERKMSDSFEAQKDTERSALHTMLKEQMHKLKHDFLVKFEAMWDAQEKDRTATAAVSEERLLQLQADLASGFSRQLQAEVLPRLQEEFLVLLKDGKVATDNSEVLQAIEGQRLESSFAQIMTAVRSQPGPVDLSPVLSSVHETKEIAQGLRDAIRAWRASTGPSGAVSEQPESQAPTSWETHEMMIDILKDNFTDQANVIRQLFDEVVKRVDMSAMTVALAEHGFDMKATLADHFGGLKLQMREMASSPGRSSTPPLQQGNLSEVLAAVRSAKDGANGGGVDMTEVLQAIKDVPRQLDLSYEFSTVLTAIQEKEQDLSQIVTVLTDHRNDMKLELEDLRSAVRVQAQLDVSRSPSRRPTLAERKVSPPESDPTAIVNAVKEAMKDHKVSIDFSVAQVLNNIQQKQQETIDRMDLTDQQLANLKEALQKLNGQEVRPRSAAPNPAPCSPRSPRIAQQWLQLPGAPWIPPGILGLEKLDRRD